MTAKTKDTTQSRPAKRGRSSAKNSELSAVGKMLIGHKKGCAIKRFSDKEYRRCSCGRDDAVLVMRGAKRVLGDELFESLFGKVFNDGE